MFIVASLINCVLVSNYKQTRLGLRLVLATLRCMAWQQSSGYQLQGKAKLKFGALHMHAILRVDRTSIEVLSQQNNLFCSVQFYLMQSFVSVVVLALLFQ